MHAEASEQPAAWGEAAERAWARAGEPLLREVIDVAPVGIALLDPELRWVHANPAFLEYTGTRPAELLGEPLAATELRAAAPVLSRALSSGSDGQEFPQRPGLQLFGRRLEPEGTVAGVLAFVWPEDQSRARLALLKTAAERIGSTLDADTTCAELARFAVTNGLADLVLVDLPASGHAVAGGGSVRMHRAALAVAPHLDLAVGELAQPGEGVRYGEGAAAARSLAAGRTVLGEAEALAGAATRMLAVPLIARGRTVGVLSLARSAGRPAEGRGAEFGADDLVLIEDLAGHAALSIDNALRYTRSQGVALELQRALLAEPANPHPNLQLATRYLPSGSSSVVGGDWYEAVRLPFGRTLLVIGDVMGHGVEAAVDMSTYRSMLRYTASMDLPPHRILRQLDALISENDTARPATCLLALADPNRRRWTFASAGHLPPALITPDRPTELVELPVGPPLGSGLADYEQLARPLLPEQVLLLYTDGLVERRHEDIDTSLARLADLPLPAAGDLEELLDTVLHHLATTPAQDDTALLAARARPATTR
ncbi:SpoIIE family protein phosphatase [Kitasatospora azatica]|uniref:SpoIIE family protein phosphatase n=1 Tax=Kitasatospora azatica TaxID=58347 RepID=UPI0005693D88|nr:SpoIIE family protein phosphatase [Kitasatospora azatica]